MSEKKQVTPEEQKELQNLREDTDRLIIALGQLQYQRILVTAQEDQYKETLLKLKAAEKEITDKLIEKYGNVTVDIDTGIIS